MFRPFRSTACLLLAGAALLPASGQAESRFAPPGQGASASLNIRIVIPAVMQVLENSHPAEFDGDQPVEQRLVVLSNMRHGFCASLRLSDPAVADGYRLCTRQPGRYTLRLRHAFGTGTQQAVLAWPVQTELMAL